MSKVIHPDYGLNGSGARNLSRDYMAAYEAAVKLREALRECTPHPRDYQESGLYLSAREMHAARVQLVCAVEEELGELASTASEKEADIRALARRSDLSMQEAAIRKARLDREVQS